MESVFEYSCIGKDSQLYRLLWFSGFSSLALSVGSDSNGSGIVALLEIARLFSFLYSNLRTRGIYNLLFGLTSGGPYNYNGTQKVLITHCWLYLTIFSRFLHSLSFLLTYMCCPFFLFFLRKVLPIFNYTIDYLN